MNISSWTLFVVYFLITNISHNKAIFSAYRRYRLHRLKIKCGSLYEVKNSTVNSSVLLPPHTLSSYFPSLGQHQPLEILFTIL